MVVLGATMGTLFSIPGQTMGFSVFTDVLMRELGLSRVSLSTAYCVGTVASGLTLPWFGRVLDQWGARRMVVASALVTGLVLFYLSQTAKLSSAIGSLLPLAWQEAVSFAVIGVGFFLVRASAQGVLTMSSRNAVGKWFDVQRGIALAVSGIAVSFGFSIAPKFLDLLIDQFEYDGAWIFLGFLTVTFMAGIGWLIFRDNPEECGLRMDGRAAGNDVPHDELPLKTSSPGSNLGGRDPIPAPHANLDMRIHRDFTRAEALATFTFWVFNLSFAFFALYSTAFTFHIVSLGEEFGISKDRIITLFVPVAAIAVLTNLFCGLVNAHTRLKYLLVMMNIGATLCAVGLAKLDTGWGVWAYVLGNGITGGAFTNLSGIVWPRFYGRKWLGAISGICMSSMVIASGIGPLLFGICEQWLGAYEPILVGSIFVPAVLAILSLRADNPQRRADAS